MISVDDISGKISEIFSNPESMEMIKNLVGMLGGGQEGSHEEQKQQSAGDASGGLHSDTQGGTQGNTPGGMPGDFPFDADTMIRMTKALSMIKKDDPRVSFLLALRPNLSEDRQKKVDEAIHLLKLVNLIPLLQEGLLQ